MGELTTNKPLALSLTGVHLGRVGILIRVEYTPQVPSFGVCPTGGQEINGCKDVLNAEELWTKYFQRIDERWGHNFEVMPWVDLDESFSFLRG